MSKVADKMTSYSQKLGKSDSKRKMIGTLKTMDEHGQNYYILPASSAVLKECSDAPPWSENQ